MHNITKSFAILAAMALASAMPAAAKDLASVKSPDGKLTLTLSEANGTVSYRLARGSKLVVENSAVGISTSLADFSCGLTVSGVAEKTIDTSFAVPAGGSATINDNCKEATVNVVKDGHTAAFVFRIYNEGVACRYTIDGSGSVTVNDEATQCNIAVQDMMLTLPLCQGTRASFTETDADLLGCMKVAALPLMVKSDQTCILVGETAPVRDYCGSRLTVSDNGGYIFTPTESVTATLPLSTPWRTIMVGEEADLAGTTMNYCLGAPAAIADVSWIKPGRAATAYCGEDHSSSYLERNVMNSYIDWAASQGWEYFTIDKNWNLSNAALKDIVNYAKAKNIGIFVWKNRASLPTTEGSLRAVLQTLKSAGVVGIKAEFWEDESVATVNHRNLLLSLAAEQKLMVLLANSVNTAGLSRTYPNLMGTESGLTNSSYVFMPGEVTAAHNINSAILKAAAGPVDYYPVDFGERNGKQLQATTHAHQLALAVAFNGGIQHIADTPDNLRYSIAKSFLKTLPCAWDETRWLDARHNEGLSLVRRSGKDYYLAALTNEAATVDIPLSFLPEGSTVNAYIYRDGTCPTDIDFVYKTGLSSTSTLSLKMLASGGAVVRLAADDGSTKPFCSMYEAEAAQNTIPFGVSVLTDKDGLCSGNAYVAGAGNGRPLVINGIKVPAAGTYAVSVYYMASEGGTGSVRLNGSLASIRGLEFINSGGTSGRAMARATVNMVFDRTENNSIEISGSGTLPSIDRITVLDNNTTVYTSGTESPAVAEDAGCTIYAEGGNIMIESAEKVSYTVYNLQGMCIARGSADAGRTEIALDETGLVIVTASTDTASVSHKIVLK